MSKKTNTKTAKKQATAAAVLAAISAKAEGLPVDHSKSNEIIAKTVSAAKAAGKVLDKHYVYEMSPVGADLQPQPEFRLAAEREFRHQFTDEESMNAVKTLRDSGNFTQVKRWANKSKGTFTVWVSNRPLDEVRADREKNLGITIKARTAVAKTPKAAKSEVVKMDEGKIVQTQA